MTQKCRVLWVEDGARYDLVNIAAPVYMDEKYDLVIAEDASSGIADLLKDVSDVIIVDIRIPPGIEKDWIKLHQDSGSDKVSARLGLDFLYTILGHPDAKIKLGDKRPAWITPTKIGVLTVESELELVEHLKQLQINVYYHKRVEMPEEILLKLIENVFLQNKGVS
jgi:DNA-binding NarL/FixJ family response regulator